MENIGTVDMGGTKVAYARVSTQGDLTMISTWATPTSLSQFERQLRTALSSIPNCIGLALAVPGVIQNHAEILISPNVHWLDNLDLKQWIHQKFGVAASISNDMEAAAKGESVYGQLRNVRCGLFETLSTGIGGAICYKGDIIPGEPGHVSNSGFRGRLCGCGKRGCIESNCSGRAAAEYVQRRFGGRIPMHTDPCAFLDSETDRGMKWAQEFYTKIGTEIGIAWSNTLNCFSAIERIVYGGTFGIRGMRFMQQHISQAIQANTCFAHHRNIDIIRSNLWPSSAHLGAATILLEPCQRMSRCRTIDLSSAVAIA